MSVRIVGGLMRGRRVNVPSSKHLRPSTDRVRESMFNMLANLVDLEGTRVLDLYAGSGILGMEALSRGAEHVTFVELAGKVVRNLRDSLLELELMDRASIVRRDVTGYLADQSVVDRFDVILADPPYDDPMPPSYALSLTTRLNHGGVVVLERSAERGEQSDVEEIFGSHFDVVKYRKIGGTAVAIAERRKAGET